MHENSAGDSWADVGWGHMSSAFAVLVHSKNFALSKEPIESANRCVSALQKAIYTRLTLPRQQHASRIVIAR